MKMFFAKTVIVSIVREARKRGEQTMNQAFKLFCFYFEKKRKSPVVIVGRD